MSVLKYFRVYFMSEYDHEIDSSVFDLEVGPVLCSKCKAKSRAQIFHYNHVVAWELVVLVVLGLSPAHRGGCSRFGCATHRETSSWAITRLCSDDVECGG
jgi:hypothetical protein